MGAPASGQFGTAAAYYSDYRYMRRPVENISGGRVFRIREKVTLNIRAEFTNVFNRARYNDPTGTAVSNAQSTQTRNAAGQTTAGFGYISTAIGSIPATGIALPRQGQIVAKFTFSVPGRQERAAGSPAALGLRVLTLRAHALCAFSRLDYLSPASRYIARSPTP